MPTIKQKKAFQELGVNGGNLTKAMKVAGYSAEVSKRTDKLTKTKGFKELMEEYLSDEDLAKAHRELLNAGFIERIGFEKDIEDEDILDVFKKAKGCKVLYIRHYKDSEKIAYVQVIDNNARKNALEMAYKLKGSYAPEKSVQLQVKVNLEQQEKINKAIDEII